ncbi:MAG: kelch repeat-containing protein [Chitinophagales bacterium]
MKLIYSFLFFICIWTHSQAQDWEQVTPLPNEFSQTHHSFGFGLDGKGYLVSGFSSQADVNKNFYQYDPTTDEWTRLEDFPGAARAYAIGDIWDGKAYFGFGRDENNRLQDLWVFDPADMTWTELASCPCMGRVHPAMIAHNGKVFVGMGGTDDGNAKDWWEYDMASDSWAQKPDFPAPARHHPYQFGIGEYIYTGLGHGNGFISNQWFRYDPATETWLQVADLPAQGRVAGTQFSHNGIGYVLSGEGEEHNSLPTGEFWSYDPDLDTWEELPPHPERSRWAPASFILDGEVYIINGETYTGLGESYYQSTVYKYDLEGGAVNTEEFVTDKTIFQAFPNPFSDALNLKWGTEINTKDANIRVFDIHNRLIFQTNGLQNQIDLSAAPNGLLRVELTTDEKRYFQTVLKQ